MKTSLKVISVLIFLALGSHLLDAQSAKGRAAALDALFIDAVQLYDDGEYKAAKDRLSVVCKAFDADGTAAPGADAAYYYMGLCDCYLENFEDAEAELKEAVRLDSTSYWYRDRLAVLYSIRGRDSEAVEVYESLQRDFPKKSEVLYNLANLYAQGGDMDKLLRTLDSIEAISGKDETTTLARYDALMRQDKAEEAFAALAAFNEDVSSARILSMMGDSSVATDKDSLALAYYAEALRLDSEYAPALIGQAEVYRINRRFGEYFRSMERFTQSRAIPAQMKSQYLSSLSDHMDARFVQAHQSSLDSLFEGSVSAHPTDSSILLTAGTYFFRSERRDRATELFRANMLQYPQSLSAAGTYVQSLSYSEDWEGLVVAAEEAFALFPQEPSFIDMQIFAHYKLERYEDVVEDCLRILDLFPDDDEACLQAYSTIGDTYHLAGMIKPAFKAYDAALRINASYAPVLNNYAYYLSLMGKRLSKAYRMSAAAVEQEPDNPTYLDTFAWILHLQGKDLEAKSFFKHAMLYGGKESATILGHYAVVLNELGEEDMARVYRDMAAKLPSDE